MDDDAGGQDQRDWRERLAEARLVLLAVAVVLLVLVTLETRLLLAALLGMVAIATIAVIPRPGRWVGAKTLKTGDTPSDSVDGLAARQLADALDDPVIIFNRDKEMVFANKAAVGAFGELAPGMALPLKFRAPDIVDLVARAISDGRGILPEYHERIPIERWFRVTAAEIEGTAGLYLLIFWDRAELRRVEKMRSDFIANASHELRTPLASISGFIETLRGPAKDDPQTRERFLAIMQGQTGRMARLIDDLLSLSRLEMKPYSRPGTQVDLRAIVTGVVRSLQHHAEEQEIAVEESYPDGPVEIPGDRDELIQVFENLLSNAYKYGGAGKRVVVSMERREWEGADVVAVTVRDFGLGIAREHIPRITERFYRVDAETSRLQKGTGLGLSIVKHILTRHRGTLVVESKVGEGSTFTVILPERRDGS